MTSLTKIDFFKTNLCRIWALRSLYFYIFNNLYPRLLRKNTHLLAPTIRNTVTYLRLLRNYAPYAKTPIFTYFGTIFTYHHLLRNSAPHTPYLVIIIIPNTIHYLPPSLTPNQLIIKGMIPFISYTFYFILYNIDIITLLL